MNLNDRANKSGEAINRLRSELEKKQGKENFSRNMKLAKKNRLLMESLSKARKESNMSQKNVASALRTSQKQISKYENLEQSPSVTKLMEFCDEIGVEIVFKNKNTDKVIFHT